jgi:tetratricopeptide (TPR) repeat protein
LIQKLAAPTQLCAVSCVVFAAASREILARESYKLMNKSVRVLALMAVGLLLLSAAGCDKLRARDQLNKGVSSYKNARYEEAIDHFQQAVTLDPSLLNARLYLATAYAQQYIPGVDAEDNNRLGQQAIDQYKAVLERDPKSVNSVKGIAYIYLQMKKFEDAKTYYRKALEIDPNDPEPYYSVGVIDWTQTYQPRMEERAKLGMKPDEQLNPKDKNEKKACDDLKQKNWANIQDGIDSLNKALQLRPDYDDAMAYMNLMYREKADVECDDLAARAEDLKTADEWVDKTMATKKAKAEKQPGAQGITMDQSK